jgi:iron complex outermembrane recepter protein
MRALLASSFIVLTLSICNPSTAQDAAPHFDPIPQITVTAQKREEPASSVGMSITAVEAKVLEERGIDSVAELTQLVPGFTVQQSSFNSTSFTLRGVGFFNSDLATPPAVSVYLDEAPLPYPAMTKLAAFDLARVEVLKGPQGTLYGQNATGGAVNYIAAAPSQSFESGMNATYGRFNRATLGGFVSGPITDGLEARFALQGQRGDAWQNSVTEPRARLGRTRELQGRGTLQWHPAETFSSRLTLTVTYDGSDSQAAQFVGAAPTVPALAVPGLTTYPIVEQPRAADWSRLRSDTLTAFPYSSDTTLLHAAWRNDWRVAGDIKLTSLTSYARLHLAYGQDPNGSPFHLNEVIDRDGHISSFHQEIRAEGGFHEMRWLLGANYAHDLVRDKPLELFPDYDLSHIFQGIDPEAYADASLLLGRMEADTYAVFGRVEYPLVDQLTVEGSVRYNSDRRTFDNCGVALTTHFTRYWNLFRGGAQPATQVGDCYVIDPANGFQPVTNVHNVLDQDSVSWRAGVNWAWRTDQLLYANVSKGYKAGAAAVLAASTVAQFEPVRQESLLAYEVGFKASLFERRVQLNASAFYYDYEDKQLRGALLDPTFGPLEALVSIPESHVAGAEMQLVARPLEGLSFDTSATYVHTRIDRFVGFNAMAVSGDQSGTPFPFSPKWHSITNLDYRFASSGGIGTFVGTTVTYNSRSHAGIGALDALRIDAYTLLDLRAGIELGGARHRIWAWGKNVANTYYWNNVFANGNAIARFVGQAATYGVSFSAHF